MEAGVREISGQHRKFSKRGFNVKTGVDENYPKFVDESDQTGWVKNFRKNPFEEAEKVRLRKAGKKKKGWFEQKNLTSDEFHKRVLKKIPYVD